MIKVFLEAGMEDRLETVVGEYITEDERYLILNDGGIRRRIPHRRVVHMEDLSGALTVQESPPELREALPTQQPKIVPGQKQFTMAELRKKLRAGRETGEIPEPTIEEIEIAGEVTLVNVVVAGAESRTLTVEVPAGSFTPDQYTASTASELSKNMEIKTLLDRGIVFDGPPTVVGKNIYIKTKHLADKVNTMNDKMNMVGKLHEAGQRFSQPDKAYKVDFSMKAESDLPAIPHSPFDGPINLEDITPSHPDIMVEGDPRIEEILAERKREEEVVQGVAYENSAEEVGAGQEGIGEETSEGDQGVFEEISDT